MDAKITKKRLGEFLSYEWLKIVAIAVALIVVWSVLFSCTSARLTDDQVFMVINYTGLIPGSDFYSHSSTLMNKNVFSYEVNEATTLDITVEDGKMAGTLLETRLTTGQGDVMLVANTEWEGQEYYLTDDSGNKIDDGNGDYQKGTQTYLQAFLHSTYHYTVMPLRDVQTTVGNSPYDQKGLLSYVYEYLDDFFTPVDIADPDKGFVVGEEMDDDAWAEMEGQFRTRVRQTQDKRFRNESLIQSGLHQEKDRLVKYRDAYNAFLGYLDAGIVTPTVSKVVLADDSEDKLVSTGEYSLNICPDDGKMPTLKETACYTTKVGEQDVITAKDMNVVFLHVGNSRREFLCEKILYVNYLVATHYVQPSNP